MTRKPLSGIDGVLGNLLSTPPATVTLRPANDNFDHVQGARLGRPLGTQANTNTSREKVTVRIAKKLIAEYRDQSWEARCSLSRLVEKALSEYRRQFRD